MIPVAKGLVLACSQWTTPLKVYDDPTVLGLCLALLLLSEAVREVVARLQNVELGARSYPRAREQELEMR